MQMLLSYLNVFRMVSSHFPLIIKGCFPILSGVEDLNQFAGFLAMLLTDKRKLLRWERIKSGKGFPLKQIFNFRKKIVTILVVVDILQCQGIFPVFLYFSNSLPLITDTSL